MKGFFIILAAALVWGGGNFVTGLTAQHYIESESLLPAVDISLANTLGGLLFLWFALFIKNGFSFKKLHVSLSNLKSIRIWNFISSGFWKGANTCLFVFSTTYLAATKSLVYESTYIFWSLLFSVFFLRTIINSSMLISTMALWAGVFFISLPKNSFAEGANIGGVAFGLLAGLCYALFLYFWSRQTPHFKDLREQILGTSLLLVASSLTILVVTFAMTSLFSPSAWIPFTNILTSDFSIQFINGIFVIGITYLLITIGLKELSTFKYGSNFVTALGLSFAVPFTLLPEFLLQKFVPTLSQLIGIILFMIGFVFISSSVASASTSS